MYSLRDEISYGNHYSGATDYTGSYPNRLTPANGRTEQWKRNQSFAGLSPTNDKNRQSLGAYPHLTVTGILSSASFSSPSSPAYKTDSWDVRPVGSSASSQQSDQPLVSDTRSFLKKIFSMEASTVARNVAQRLPRLATGNADERQMNGCSFYSKNVLKLIVILFCTILCTLQVVDIGTLYFKYPTAVNVIVDEPKRLHLPGISVCNNNRITLSHLEKVVKERNGSDLKEELQKQEDEIKAKYAQEAEASGQERRTHHMTLAKWLDSYFVGKASGATVMDFLRGGTQMRKFITELNCDIPEKVKGEPDDHGDDQSHFVTGEVKGQCIRSPHIPNAQPDGTCFTWFYDAATKDPNAAKSDDDDDDDDDGAGLAGIAPAKAIQFDPGEVVKMQLDFQPEEYTDLSIPTSGRLIIHDNTEIPSSLSKSFFIRPGRQYAFFVERIRTQLMPPPYDTACQDFFEDNYNASHASRDYTLPLSREQCVTKCFLEAVLKSCDCWPPEVPYVPRNRYDPEGKLKWCTYRGRGDAAKTMFVHCVGESREACSHACASSCVKESYNVHMQERDWPTKEQIEMADSEKKQKRLSDRAKCCARVSIRYWTTERTTRRYTEKFKWVEIACYVGGLVSMWLGFSFLALYQVLAWVGNRIKVSVERHYFPHL